ncbi:MAG: protein-glutamate O-methyltransferase CheR [Spirochaetia bacterium]|nr:protein-glutamate O-methyltransferase CheR [Spirochaetia bacterium]
MITLTLQMDADYKVPSRNNSLDEITMSDQEFNSLSELVYLRTGIVLTDKKRGLVYNRLRHVLRQNEIPSFHEYNLLLRNDDTGFYLSEFISRITTNFTYFNRENSHFSFMCERVLPKFTKETMLRVWSAGCATGAETYDLAMNIQDYSARQKAIAHWMVLGTDISREAIDRAAAGTFSLDQVENVPDDKRKLYFTRDAEGRYVLRDTLRTNVKFRVLNLLRESLPFQHKFHIIFCRNVMIYFDEKTRTEVVRKLINCLTPGGYLFLGHCEALPNLPDTLRREGPSIYSRR